MARLSRVRCRVSVRVAAHRVHAAREGDVDEWQGVGGDVGEHPGEVQLRQAGQGVLQQDAGQEDQVKHGQALEQVGEGRLELNILLGEGPHTQHVS